MKNNNIPLVSVLMSAYNAEKYIAESVESILNQTLKNFELIIINDASTDKTLEIANNYAKKDKRVIVISNKINLYATKSRNNGLKIARGKYIAIQDADDISMQERIEIQSSFLENNNTVSVIGSGVIKIDENGKEIERRMPITNSFILRLILPIKNCIYHPSVMFRNSGFKYRDKIYYSEDYDLYLNVLSGGKKLLNLNCHLVKYRILKNSVSNKTRKKQLAFGAKARKFFLQRFLFGCDGYDKFDPKNILQRTD